jgi:hypothetical protein
MAHATGTRGEQTPGVEVEQLVLELAGLVRREALLALRAAEARRRAA